MARLTATSNARLARDPISMPFAHLRVDLHLASLTLQHDGRTGDDALAPRRVAFAFRRNGSTGALLTGTEYSQMFSQVRLFGDDGDDTYEPGVDPPPADASAAGFNNGALSAAAQTPLAFGTTRTFHFVAQLTLGARNVACILHISPSAAGSEAVNAAFDARADLNNGTFGTTLDLDMIFRSRSR